MFWPFLLPQRMGGPSVSCCLSPWCRLRRALVLVLAFAALSGCNRYVRLDLQAGPCLNPPDQFCNENGTNSRVLEFNVYQLKEPVDVASLSWDEITTPGGDYPVLTPYLSDPENKVLVKRTFTMQRQERRTEKIKRLWKFKHLLVVTAGRFPEDASIAQTRIRFFHRWQSLCFEYYSVEEPIDDRRWLGRMLRKKASDCEFSFEIDPNAIPPLYSDPDESILE